MRRQPQKQEDLSKLYVDIYNLPQHGNKEDITYFLWKALQKCKALVKHTNPIIKCQLSDNQGYIRLFFRSRQQLLNCLDLNGIFYGQKSFYMKSPITMRLFPQINPPNSLNIRRISSRVQDSFNKLCISNLPEIKQFEIINFLVTVGQLKSFQTIFAQQKLQHCFFEYHKNDDAQSCLSKLNNQKIKDKKVVIKRAALMGNLNNDSLGKSTLNKIKPKSFLFESDIHSHFLTFDTVGFFKNMKISCVILLKNIIYSQAEKQMIKEDIRRQVQKIGPVVKMLNKDKNIYIQYQRVQYAQICYLLLMSRKFDGRSIDISFYDPLNFGDLILI